MEKHIEETLKEAMLYDKQSSGRTYAITTALSLTARRAFAGCA
jgi:hypothetical protein